MTGEQFGRWLVLSHAGGNRWLCKCACGSYGRPQRGNLLSGESKSCGCWQREEASRQRSTHREAVHGHRTTEYKIWNSMLARCHTVTSKDYPRYGGSGVVVCERWRASYENFLQDVGRRPSTGHSLDRHPNGKGNYEPGNVRWATNVQQARNKKSNRLVTYAGMTQCVAAWATQMGVSRQSLRYRLEAGWPLPKALAEWSPWGEAFPT